MGISTRSAETDVVGFYSCVGCSWQWKATGFPVVFEGWDGGGFFRAFHAVDECDTDGVGVVVRVGCFAAEVDGERHVPDVNEGQGVE